MTEQSLLQPSLLPIPQTGQFQEVELLLKRNGNLLQLSRVGDLPLPAAILAAVKQKLSFLRQTFLNKDRRQLRLEHAYANMLDGSDPYAPFKPQPNVVYTRILLCQEVSGAILTTYGMLAKLYTLLVELGVRTWYVDLSPPRYRANCYEPDWARVAEKMPTIRDDQWRCLRQIEATECGTIVAAMGFGKSFLVPAVCHLFPNANIHYVVPQKDVALTVYRDLLRFFPEVGLFGGGKQLPGRRITVFVAGSMHRSDGNADILLCDEVHEMMTDRYVSLISQIWSDARRYSLTATPDGRSDNNDEQIELCFGPEIFRMTYQEAVAKSLVVPIRVRWIEMNFREDPVSTPDGSPLDLTSKMRFGIWRHKARNRKIAEDVRQNYPDLNTQVLILCATVDHAIHLWQFLPEFALCFADKDTDEIAQYVKSGMLPHNFERVTAQVRERMRDAFRDRTLKRVIATDVWATGVDFRALQVLYRVDGRASANKDSQGPGRTSRLHAESGKAYGEVIDCYDSWNRGFRQKSDKRRTNYKALGWEQIKTDGRR